MTILSGMIYVLFLSLGVLIWNAYLIQKIKYKHDLKLKSIDKKIENQLKLNTELKQFSTTYLKRLTYFKFSILKSQTAVLHRVSDALT